MALTIDFTNSNVATNTSVNAISHTTGATGTGTGGLIANVTTLFIGNNTINTSLTTIGLSVNAVTIANTLGVYTGIVNATTHSAGPNVSFTNASVLFTGNTTTSPTITLANTGNFVIGNSSTTQTTSTIVVANSTGNVQITAGTTSILATGIINAASHTVGTATVANATGIYTTGTVNAASHTVGTAFIANATGVYTTGTVNAASHTAGTSTVANNLGFYTGPTGTGTGGLNATATTVFVGNNTVNTVLTNALLLISNSTSNIALTPMSFKIKGSDVLRLDSANYSVNNIALGMQAMASVTTADKNTALGKEALYSLDTGNNNIAIGYQSGYGLGGNAAYNVAIGYNTLINGAFGILGNICVGHNSLNLTLGNYSTAIGYQALANTSDGYHVGVGTNVLLDVSTGTYNTAVGANTGRGITTGSYNTIIGSQVTGLAAALANTIIIADGAGVKRITANSTSSYIVANTLTVGTGTYFVSNGNVGIGTSTPGTKLVISPSSFGTGIAPFNKIRLFDDGANNVYGLGMVSGYMDIGYSGSLRFNYNSLTTNVSSTFASMSSNQLVLTGTDGTTVLLIAGATKGVRTFANSGGTYIEGVDNTGAATYQPLALGGSTVSMTISNVEKFKVDSSGNVTMPSQPAFMVGISATTDASFAVDTLVSFNSAVFNRGSYFNTSTYLFTAPVAGVYSFTFNLYYTNSGSSTSAMQAGIRKNGAFVSVTSGDAYGVGTGIPNNTGGYIEFSTTVLLSLSASDTVGVAARSGTGIRIYQGHSNFSGYLIG